MSETAITQALLDDLTAMVSRAGAVVLQLRAQALSARAKADGSPVTAADEACEACLLKEAARLLPGMPVVSEEMAERVIAPQPGSMFLLLDPVDGTRELIAGRDEFTVNLAIVGENGRPFLGIIAAPALGLLWRARDGGPAERLRLAPGAPPGAAAAREAIRPRPLPATSPTVALSRSHLDADTEALVARIGPVARIMTGSAIKFCRVAEGSADLYPRLAPTRAWDIAAGDAIVSIAGGCMTAPTGEPLNYAADPDFIIPGFIACGDPQAPARLKLWPGASGRH